MTKSVSASRTIGAQPEVIFDLLADAHRHTEFDGSDSLVKNLIAPERLFLGATFSMRVHVGVSYTIEITVIDFDESKAIEWTHWAKHSWRYELHDNNDGSTTVTERWSWEKSPWYVQLGLRLARFPAKNKKNIEKTLQKIASLVEN